MSYYVTIYYGPYESFCNLSHKPQKLKGLKDHLLKLGYRVDLRPVPYRELCVLEMCGHEIFRCNIKNLQFNTPYDLDPVCQRAVDAAVAASAKFQRASNHAWIYQLLEKQIFTRNPFAPKDYWPKDIKLNSKLYASCLECATCCNIALASQSD